MKNIVTEKYMLTLLICMFLGVFGVHRFINGKVGTGILMIFTFGGFGIWYYVDLIMILSNNFKDKEGNIVGYTGPFVKKPVNIIVLCIVSFFLLSAVINSTKTSNEIMQKPEEVAVVEKITAVEEVPVAETALDLTKGQKNAIKKAESYLRMSGFSKSGLKNQLLYEQFSDEEADFAVNNVNVDWNEQAVAKAKSYDKMGGFSRSGLVDQLLYEGFSQAESDYAVDTLGY